MHLARFVILVLFAALGAWSCSGDDTPSASQCKVDQALVEAAGACVSDEHCPCGTHCLLGACGSQCSTDDDCGGGRCDDFGRCRDVADNGQTPTPAAERAAELIVSTEYVRFQSANEARLVRVSALGRALGRVRITAPEGFSVACDGTDFTAECSYAGLAASDTKALRVRLDQSIDTAQAGALRIFHGPDRYTVSLQPDQAVAPGPRRGAYSGFAKIERRGLSVAGADVPSVSEGLVHSLTAELFVDDSGTGFVVLHDTRRAIHPTGTLVGEIQVPAGQEQGTVAWPTFEAVADGAALVGLGTRVVARPVSPEVSFIGTGPTLSFSLALSYEGIGEGQVAPSVVYSVVLSRQGPLDTDAVEPTDPVADAAAPQPGRRDVASTWETSVFSTFDPGTVFDPEDPAGFFDQSDRGQLDVCDPVRSAQVLDAEVKSQLSFQYEGEVLSAEDPLFATSKNPFVRGLTETMIRAGLTPANDRYITGLQSAWVGWEGTAPVRSLPCQVAFDPTSLGSCNTPVDTGSIDMCDDMAAQYGCTVGRSDGTRANITYRFDMTSADAFSFVCSTPLGGISLGVDVERTCVFDEPLGGAGCAQMGLCYVPRAEADPDNANRSSASAALLGDSFDPAGDLACAEDGRSAGLFDARQNTGLFSVYSDCVNELELARNAVVPNPGSVHGEGLRQVLADDAGCLDPARFALSLGLATRPSRRDSSSPLLAADEGSLALAHRLMQQWLTLHGLVAREAAQLDPIRAVLQLDGQGTSVGDVDPADAFDVSLRGWNLLLHPRFFAAIDSLPDRVAYNPDYRRFFTASALEGSDAQDGLPVFMIETLDAQAQLLDQLVRRGHRRAETEVLDVLGEFLRTDAAVRAIAAGLVGRVEFYAAANDLPPAPWLERYFRSARAYERTLYELTQTARSFEIGRNPLGIEDSDLPLYFLGNESNAASRFAAISDFLLGAPGAANPFGKGAVNEAQAALEAARSAGLMLQTREFERTLEGVNLDNRLDDIRRSYGDTVVSYCGLPPSLTDPKQVLEMWPSNFSSSNCYLLSSDPQCIVPVEDYEKVIEVDDVAYQFCVVRELRARTGEGIGFANPTYDAVASQLANCGGILEFPIACPEGLKGPCAACSDFPTSLLEDIGSSLADLLDCESSPNAPECLFLDECGNTDPNVAVSPSCYTFEAGPQVFQAVQGLTEAPVALLEEAKRACRAELPGARTNFPSPDEIPGRRETNSACYNGSLGEMALTLRAVSIDVGIARSEMGDLQDAYDVAIRSCIIQQKGNDLLEGSLEQHNRTMSALRDQKATADKVAAGAAATKDCAGGFGLEDAFSFGATAAAECAAAGVEAAMTIDSIAIGVKMDEAEASHAALMVTLENEITEQLCFNDAELHLVGVKTASLRVQRAAQDLSVALYQFDQAKSSAQVAYDAGRAALEIARARSLAPPSHDYWFNENVDTYVAKMRIARRIIYLAVRAVEYEFQASLMARQDVLAAEIPGDLDNVVSSLLGESATRGVNGSRPADLKIVLSLRKNLLQLGDLSKTQPEGWHQLNDVERFHGLLRSTRFAEYDDTGRYTGQKIPFELAPLGAFKLGETQGVSVFATNDCAERLWSVNASIIGEDLYRGDAPTFARIDLLKSNTFFSQWCADGQATPYQAASVRPSRNLFRQPQHAASFGEASAEQDEMSRARIEAIFNVDRAEFERDEFSSGSTSELAARGLYGKYAIFIPVDVVSTEEGKDGLVLDNMDDILIRLDYVSVAR